MGEVSVTTHSTMTQALLTTDVNGNDVHHPSSVQSEATATTIAAAAEQKRKADAAAARRKRRKALVRRTQRRKPASPSSRSNNNNDNNDSSPSSSHGGRHGPRSVASPDGSISSIGSQTPRRNGGQQQNPLARNNGAPSISPTPTSQTTTITSLHPTVEGITSVSERWCQGEIVAVPTECSYEACILLQTPNMDVDGHAHPAPKNTPLDWAYRIQALRHTVQAPVSLSSSVEVQQTIHSHRRHAEGTPLHCWVPCTAECPFLQDCLPHRVYLMRDSNGKVQLTHRFNETYEVLRRIARHVWPGPMTIRVDVPAMATPTDATRSATTGHRRKPFWSLLHQKPHGLAGDGAGVSAAATSNAPAHFVLRSPRHPLAMKVLSRAYDGHQPQPGSNGSTASPRRSPQPGSPQLGPLLGSPTIDNLGSLGTEPLSPPSVLIGFPIRSHRRYNSHEMEHGDATQRAFCTSSNDVIQQQHYRHCSPKNLVQHHHQQQQQRKAKSAISAVLDGEDRREVFAVPTCEYQEPWEQHYIHIHTAQRTVVLVQPPSVTTNEGGASRNIETIQPFMSTTPDFRTSPQQLRAALKQRIPNPARPLSARKDQMIQAVMSRWKVVVVSNLEN